jgi:hypothetical protein
MTLSCDSDPDPDGSEDGEDNNININTCSTTSTEVQKSKLHSFIMCNVPTKALVCNKTLIQMSHIKTLKITLTFFDHQLIIIRELFDPS